ncbi:hydrogenase maturation protease [bacterium]|nr:hydrogenase maturation protease [bacterium]
MGDDALGPTAIAHLVAGYEFPAGVHVEDLGTPGNDLHPQLAGRDHIILVDVVKADGTPGEVREYRREAILAHAPGLRTGSHDPGLKEALFALEFAGEEPELLLVGVVPGEIGHAKGLTSAVRVALPAVEAAVLAELERLGVPATPRAAPAAPELWWEHDG